jgi:NAD(P)H-nitrite reductase large subunit
MKKIVILGHSLAALSAIKRIREADPESAFTLISTQGPLPYHRDLFSEFVAGRKTLKGISAISESEYQKLNVEFIGKKIVRVNFSRNRMAFEDKQTLDYDVLLIADTEANKFPEVKGAGKEGVFGLRKLTDIQEMNEGLILTETIVVVTNGIAGLKMACALAQRKKEVILVTSGDQVLSGVLDAESAQWMQGKFQEMGIRVIANNTIAEILGNGDVKAIRLKTGKVIASQTVIFADAGTDLRLFRETDLKIDDGIVVNAALQTNFENVYAVDQVAQVTRQRTDQDYDSFGVVLEQQGEIVGASLKGEARQVPPVIPCCDFSLGQNLVQLLGNTSGKSQLSFSKVWQEDNVFLKIFLQDQVVVGGCFVNFAPARAQVAALIEKGTSLPDIAEQAKNESLKPAEVLNLLSGISKTAVTNPP